MKEIHIYMLDKSRLIRNSLIITALMVTLYFLISLYFTNHFYFRTTINGIDMSLKACEKADEVVGNQIKDYKLLIIEKDGRTEEISGQDIGLQYNPDYSFKKICRDQKPFLWIGSLLRGQKYEEVNLFLYSGESLSGIISRLNCLNRDITKSLNAGFQYNNGIYEVTGEVYGNEIDKDKLTPIIKMGIAKGVSRLDINENHCYIEPEYTRDSDKTKMAKSKLDKYISSEITYLFGSKKEVLDKTTISRWLHVDDHLNVTISKAAVKNYINMLSSKYDTIGTARSFKTSTGKLIEVEGGLYGWKINRKDEAEELMENIKQGSVIKKEPLYTQKALDREKDEIGTTYVEINITRQQLWFYKNSELLVQGPVVTGNPNRGNSTVTGIYMLNYKQKDTSLEGANYDVKVTYWMPFYGNMGIHDASWRYSFGGEIYKRNGTHGCVNAPLYLAKKIFENIEEGIPIVIYEEDKN